MLSYAVAVTHNSPRPAPSAATIKSHLVTRLFPPRKSKFLIATPRLEFPPTHSKQTPLTFSNREYIAVFQFFPFRRKSENRSKPLTHVTPALPTRNAGLPRGTRGVPAGSFALSRLLTLHSSLITSFLIATPRLEFPPTRTKQTPLTFSNRDYIAVFQIFVSPHEYKHRPSAIPPAPTTQPKNTPPVSHLTHLRPRTTIVRSSLHQNFYRDHP